MVDRNESISTAHKQMILNVYDMLTSGRDVERRNQSEPAAGGQSISFPIQIVCFNRVTIHRSLFSLIPSPDMSRKSSRECSTQSCLTYKVNEYSRRLRALVRSLSWTTCDLSSSATMRHKIAIRNGLHYWSFWYSNTETEELHELRQKYTLRVINVSF